jgi:hypothetical protein
MRTTQSCPSPTLDAYLAALLADDSPGSAALAAEVLCLGFNKDERRDERGRWTKEIAQAPPLLV